MIYACRTTARRFGAALLLALALAVPALISAHEIPNDALIQSFVKASGQQLTPGDDHVVVPRVTDDDRPDRHPVWRCRVIDRGREGSRRRRSIGARRRRDRR